MLPSKNKPFINANLRVVRLYSEHCDVADGHVGGTVTLEMRDSSGAEVRWEQGKDGMPILAIHPTIDVVFLVAETGNPVITYKSSHVIHFSVTAYVGFDPENDLPTEAAAPYLEMALWITRMRAQASIRSMGVNNFSWTTSEVTDDKRSEETKLDDSPTIADKPEKQTPPKKRKLTQATKKT